VRTLDGIDMLSGMLPEQSLVGESLVAISAGKGLIWSGTGLAVEMVL